MKMQPRLVVNEEVVKKNIRLNLERLHRQYLLSVKQYNEVSLLDLSHALRQWVDMALVKSLVQKLIGSLGRGRLAVGVDDHLSVA